MSVIAYVLAKLFTKGTTGSGRGSNPNPDYRKPAPPPEWDKGKYRKDRPDYKDYTPTSTVPRDTSAHTTISRGGLDITGMRGLTQRYAAQHNQTLKNVGAPVVETPTNYIRVQSTMKNSPRPNILTTLRTKR